MRSLNSVIFSLCFCVTVPVMADNPVTDAAAAAPTAPAPAAVPATSVAPAASSSATAPAKKISDFRVEADAVRAKELRAAGYRPETQNGEMLWCRKEAQTGSTFQKKTCASAEASEQSVKESQDFASRMQRQSVTTMKGN
jgi:hypothetical protein